MSSTQIASPALPLPTAHPIPSRALSQSPIDNFGTHESEHDKRPLSTSSEVLPPYFEAPPEYSTRGSNEPATLAMFLFKFGFCKFFFILSYIYIILTHLFSVFPPFWIMGAFIALSPLRAPPSPSSSQFTSDSEDSDLPCAWLPEKTDAERQEIIQRMRKTELKWSRRCLAALLITTLIAVAIGLAVWAVKRN
jgi:hypothetical protein